MYRYKKSRIKSAALYRLEFLTLQRYALFLKLPSFSATFFKISHFCIFHLIYVRTDTKSRLHSRADGSKSSFNLLKHEAFNVLSIDARHFHSLGKRLDAFYYPLLSFLAWSPDTSCILSHDCWADAYFP